MKNKLNKLENQITSFFTDRHRTTKSTSKQNQSIPFDFQEGEKTLEIQTIDETECEKSMPKTNNNNKHISSETNERKIKK